MMLGGLGDGCGELPSDSLQEFHAFFAANHSGNYLQALLVQDQERRNAENLSESVGISARAMQRFLTEAHRARNYRLGHPEAVWVFDGSDFPKQGRKSAGVARQYCGRLGKVANCQGGMFLAYVSPLGRALVDKRLYLRTSDQDRCAAAGVPEDRRNYRQRRSLEMLERVLELGSRVGCRRIPGGTGGPGDALVLDVPGGFGLALGPGLDQSGISGVRPPPQTQGGLGSGGPWSSAVMNCRMRLGGR